ncbi:gas vesicle protein [Streptomyces sp. A7024]|uniref:Gas vesicle protein n=1 Tax=Streptomyces coryli TaxID=1128680 RepID=A0A6G4U202_9ACTN|nr:gas vesicle protein [Streptomyces coryli]NGN66113.1 gas vesicle protein [Streptomyces coryli]
MPAREIALVDLLDRLLAGGAVVAGDLTLSIADVDLVVIDLRALLTSVTALEEAEDDDPSRLGPGPEELGRGPAELRSGDR